MFILHVTYETREGQRDAFLQKLAELDIAGKSRREAGNLDYTYYLPVEGGDRVFLCEVWESREAQAAHTQTEHFRALGAVKNDYVLNTVLKTFEGA